MALKVSSALLAAMATLAGPAVAQDAATPTQTEVPSVLPESLDTETNTAAETVNQAGEGAAATDAPTAVTPPTGEAAPGAATDPATDPAADSAAGAATESPAAADAPAADAPAADSPAADSPADAPAAAAPAAEVTPTPAGPTPADPNAPPAVGAYYVKSTHTDWTIRCIKADSGTDPCELYQLMTDDNGNSVAEITMIPLDGDVVAGATVVAPLETDLIFGLNFRVDGGNPRIYPFNFCAAVGCVSRMGFNPAELTAMKRGNTAVVTLLPFGGDLENPVSLDLSLSGFTAGFDELTELAAAAQADGAAAAGTPAETPAQAPAAEPAADAAPAN